MPAPDSPENDASGPQDQVVMVMTLMRALQGVMTAENELLRQLRLDRLLDLQVEKAALVQAYELALSQLREVPKLQAGLTPAERDALNAGVRELVVAVRRNIDRLTEARAAVDEIAWAIDESLSTMDDGAGLVPRPRLASGD